MKTTTMQSTSHTSPGLRPFLAVSLALLAVIMVTGCKGPRSKPSPIMQSVPRPTLVPAAGQSLVLIHRPRAYQGHPLYTGVWDGTNFIADLGNGHSVAYPCEPGRHYLLNRSVERVGVVAAELLPDQIYDLHLTTCGMWIASFQIEPLRQDDKLRRNLPKWEKEHLWVGRNEKAAKHEAERQLDVNLILKDFVSGEKQDRLRHIKPEDHR